jgi:YbgC/YbaW family acyl-CoA thioester hydrolase
LNGRYWSEIMFEYRLNVRGYELDSFGHVNNAVYLNYFEQARWEIIKQADLINWFRDNQLFLVVTETKVRYSSEAKLFDELLIRTKVEKEAPYLVFYQKMYFEGSKVKACSAIVKTLLRDKEKHTIDIPGNFLIKLK